MLGGRELEGDELCGEGVCDGMDVGSEACRLGKELESYAGREYLNASRGRSGSFKEVTELEDGRWALSPMRCVSRRWRAATTSSV